MRHFGQAEDAHCPCMLCGHIAGPPFLHCCDFKAMKFFCLLNLLSFCAQLTTITPYGKPSGTVIYKYLAEDLDYTLA